MHFFFVALAYSQHTVQTKATLTASVDIGAHPLAWVVIVFFCMLSGQCRIGSHGVVCFTNFAYQSIFGSVLQHINFPRLRVGSARRTRCYLQQILQHSLLHRFVQIRSCRESAQDGRIHAVRVRDDRAHLGCCQYFHESCSRTLINDSERACGLRVCLST